MKAASCGDKTSKPMALVRSTMPLTSIEPPTTAVEKFIVFLPYTAETAMMSHFKNGVGNGPCLRQRRSPPPATIKILKAESAAKASRTSPENYCAAHLAMLTSSALDADGSSDRGLLVDYASMPGALEAFFLRPTSSAAQRAEVHSQREAFISEYRLKEGGAPPMLMYDEKRTSGPFSDDVPDF